MQFCKDIKFWTVITFKLQPDVLKIMEIFASISNFEYHFIKVIRMECTTHINSTSIRLLHNWWTNAVSILARKTPMMKPQWRTRTFYSMVHGWRNPNIDLFVASHLVATPPLPQSPQLAPQCQPQQQPLQGCGSSTASGFASV